MVVLHQQQSTSSSQTPTKQSTTTSSTQKQANDDEWWNSITLEEEQRALNSLLTKEEAQDPQVNSHLYKSEDGDLSKLQRITARRILTYELLLADPNTPTESSLQTQLQTYLSTHGPILPLHTTLQNTAPSTALAAEFKRASPSKGDMTPPDRIINAGDRAVLYAKAGACMISVLTEERYFKGSLEDLEEVRMKTQAWFESTQQHHQEQPGDTMHHGQRPLVLRKEFVFSTYQILEAAAHGADTILLIVAVLPKQLLKQLITYARSLDMEPLVEIHSLEELDVAIEAGAKVLGVNNRNLHTFQLDLATTDRTAEELTKRGLAFAYSGENGEERPQYVLCALSGMSHAKDVQRYRELGVGMVLLGESLMRTLDVGGMIKGLCLDPADYEKEYGGEHENVEGGGDGGYDGGTKVVKVCGISNPEDALAACQAGANLVGVIFVPKSKRCVSSTTVAQDICKTVQAFGERSAPMDFQLQVDNENISNMVRRVRKSTEALTRACTGPRARPLVVGVFQNVPSEEVAQVVKEVGLDLVQLHGEESLEECGKCGVPAIKVLHVNVDEEGEDGETSSGEARADAMAEALLKADAGKGAPMAFLLDTAVKGVQGGTGRTFDWSIANGLQKKHGLPVLVAGGLTPENVHQVVEGMRPWGVDVAGGVELKGSEGRQKDGDKVKAFVAGVRDSEGKAKNKGDS